MTQPTNAGIVRVLALAGLLAASGVARADDAAEFRAAFAKARQLQQQGEYAPAARLYERALQLAPRVFGPDHVNTAITLNNLANVYNEQGRHAEAEAHHRRALAIREKARGPDHPDVAASLNNLAILCGDQGKYAEAEVLNRRALAIKEKTLGPDHPDVASSLVNLGVACKEQGKYAEAEPLYRRALAIREKALGPNHTDVAVCLNNMALLHVHQGNYAAAEPLYRRTLAIEEKALGPDHPSVAKTVENLALLKDNQGKYGEAELLCRRALAICQNKFGPDHPSVGRNTTNLARIFIEQGKYAEAEPLCRRALVILEKAFGPEHPEVATSLTNFATLYFDQAKYAEAEPLYRRALAIREKALGVDHRDAIASLGNLAALYAHTGRSAEAESLYRRVLALKEKTLSPDHPNVATDLNNLAVHYDRQGRFAEAEPLHRRALAIREKVLGSDHTDVGQSLNNLALAVGGQSRWAEAANLLDRLRRSARRFVARELTTLPESDQLAFLETSDAVRLQVALGFGLERRADPAVAALSAGWLLNGKAIAHQALAERALLERDLSNPARRDLARQLQEARRRHAALAMTAAKPGEEGRRADQLRALDAQRNDLERKLAAAGGTTAAPGDPWVELDAVRKRLPADGTLVEFARVRPLDFAKGRFLPDHYAAWVIPPAGRGAVQVIDLGPADRIDAAVAAARQALQDAAGGERAPTVELNSVSRPKSIAALGEADAERLTRTALDALAKLVLRPLLPAIASQPRWTLSPDASLWLVPWAALPLDATTYVVEKHTVSFVVSGRDLAAAPAAQPTNAQPPAVFANPDFDLTPAEAAARVRKLLPGVVAGADGVRGLTSSGRLPRVEPLPGTAAEAQAVQPSLLKLCGRAPAVYQGGDALEAVAKSLKGPRVAVFSTHGFALPDQEVERNDTTGDAGKAKSGRPLENPLLRCGLLLAGANRRGAGTAEDGVLTGLEIVGTDLRGTELVVLSACETGLGTVRTGEGVAGLRQAFQLAGARSVVATLWQVPDRESAALMSGFFDGLASGKSQADALRAAQLAHIKSRRQRNAAAHPYYWAAYTVTGP